MAASDTTIGLKVLSAIFKERYLDEYNENPSVFMGRAMNRIITPGHSFDVDSDGVNIVTENYIGDIFRSSNNPLADPITPDRFDAQSYKVRYSPDNTSPNDFMSVDGSLQISHVDLQRLVDKDGAAYVPVYKRLVQTAKLDFDSKMAIWRSTPRSGFLGSVNGSLIDGAGTVEYSGSTFTSNTDVRFKVDNGAFVAFRRGMKLRIYNGAGSAYVEARVEGKPNADDRSIRVIAYNNTFTGTASSWDNGSIYFSGASDTSNFGMYGFEEWFSEPQSGESWIGGKDRTDASFGFLNTQRVKAVSSGTTKISRKHFDRLAEVMQHSVSTETEKVRILASVDIVNSLRSALGNDAFTVADIGGESSVKFGHRDLAFQHPFLGTVVVSGDPLVHPNKVYAIAPSTWRTAMIDDVAKAGFKILDGDVDGWYRTSAASGGADSRSKYWRMDMANFGLADICLVPEANAVLLNVKA